MTAEEESNSENPEEEKGSPVAEFWKEHRYEIMAPLVAIMIVIGLFREEVGFFLHMEYLTQDMRFKVRTDSDEPSHQDLTLLQIDEESINDFGRWPWPRNIHATLLQLLDYQLPKVIAYDLFFSEEDTENDDAFAESMLFHDYVISGAYGNDDEDLLATGKENPPKETLGPTREIENIVGDKTKILGQELTLFPVQKLRENSYFAFVNVDPSRIDGIRRRLPLVYRTGKEDSIYPSLSLQSLIRFWDLTVDDIEVVLGQHIKVTFPDDESVKLIPINDKGEFMVNYRNDYSFNAHSYTQLMADLLRMHQNGDPYPEDHPQVEGKIVLVGQTSAGLTDLGPTPLKGKAPLVLVHANVISNILKEDYLKVVDVWPIFMGALVMMWISLFMLKDKPALVSMGIPACIIATYVVVAIYLFGSYSIQLPFLQPILAYAGVHMGAFYIHWKKEQAQKDRIKGMFGTYLSPELVHTMVESGEEPQLGGVDTEITAFFSDVQGFSGFSEQLSPQGLVELMNEYLTAMTRILLDHGCYVDKYIGDAIVGIFNAPLEVEHHALKGCIASMYQHKKLDEMRAKWLSEGDKWPPIVAVMQARLGMNTGHATVGNMGSEDRFNYTMMGDTVNLAARCESGAKAYGVYSMVTGETKEAACNAGDDCIFRYLDKIVVKGRSAPAEMYEIVCLKEDLNPEIEQCLETYNKAIEIYLKQEWDKAYELFEAASKLEPNRPELNDQAPTTPSSVMMERTLAMKENPPGADWDGVYIMTTK